MKIIRLFRITIRRYFWLGLVVFIPLIVTIKFLSLIIGFFDDILAVHHGRFLWIIPERFHPHSLLGFPLPGLGVVFSFLCIIGLGFLSRNYFGKKLLRMGDYLMDHIPLARSIYKVVRDMIKIFSRKAEKQFNKVVLIHFPHNESYALAFLTGDGLKSAEKATQRTMLNVFIPTTPNPTSGFLLFVPKDQVLELDLTIEEAFKLIVSGGMVNPEKLKPKETQSET